MKNGHGKWDFFSSVRGKWRIPNDFLFFSRILEEECERFFIYLKCGHLSERISVIKHPFRK